MTEEGEGGPQAAPGISVEAEGKGQGYRWSLRATGYWAVYLLLSGVLFVGFYKSEVDLPGSVMMSIAAVGVLGIRFGVDIAGGQVRRLEAEVNRYIKEIDRVAAERNALQGRHLSAPQSSKKRGKR